MPPIRVGLIGLSTISSPMLLGSWTSLAHLPYLLSSPHYEIVALANSSVASAEASIAHYKLSAKTKAYGSPEDIAKDPNVELIVISVNVRKHYALAKPAVLAGKDVFVEWPLGASTAEAEELSSIARTRGVRTMLGLQARADPLLLKIKQLVSEGKIGKVMSSTVVGRFAFPLDAWLSKATYTLDMDSGGNNFTISFGHFLNSFIHVLGDFSQVSSIIKAQYPFIKLMDDAGNVTDPNYRKTAPDHISILGTLESGAIASISIRSPCAAIDGTGLSWIVSGTEGEIEITSPGTSWQFRAAGVTLKLRNGKSMEAKEVDFSAPSGSEPEVSQLGINTAQLYEAFAKKEVDKYADFEDGLATHHSLDKILSGSK